MWVVGQFETAQAISQIHMAGWGGTSAVRAFPVRVTGQRSFGRFQTLGDQAGSMRHALRESTSGSPTTRKSPHRVISGESGMLL
jgi:hypothetical protein